MNSLCRLSAAWVMLPLLIGIGPSTQAQQDPLFSQYMFNTLAFNPAYAGNSEVFTMMVLSRHQWVGIEGAPSTQTFVAHSPLRKQALAVGFSAMNDRIGPARQTGAFVDVAYRIRTGADTRLSFGLKGGVNGFSADLASLSTVVPDQSNVSIQSRMMPNFGFGLYWHSPRYYVGLSAPKLLENEVAPSTNGVVTTAAEARHFFVIAGYVLPVGRDIKFKPSMMARMVKGAPLSLDVNASFLLRERIWLGAMYRVGNAFGFVGQYQVNDQLRVGYAFDLTTTRLGAYNAGTHEVMISYDFRFIKGRTISPRYF